MSYDVNDPRWTAYILDELDAGERDAIEAELAADEGAREYVDSLRAATELLELGFLDDPSEQAPKLDDIQRQRVVSAAAKSPRRANWALIGAGVAAAAGLVLFVLVDRTRSGDESAESAELEKLTEGVDRLRDEYKSLSVTPEQDGYRQVGSGDVLVFDPTEASSSEEKGLHRSPRRPSAVTGTATTSTPVVAGIIAPDSDGDMDGKVAGTHDTEQYDHIAENGFVAIVDDPLSTFSIDVDTASYSNMRRFVNRKSLPPAGAVRIEEMINYFDYAYAPPTSEVPFAVHVDVAEAPWAPTHRLVRIGLKGREFPREHRPSHNLVFLIDVSGSMNDQNKLPLLQKAMSLLVDNLEADDRIAIVTYAGSAGVVLDSTSVSNTKKVKKAIDALRSGGSTNGAQGIERAYEIATAQFAAGGVNRVILATDGDFNVGASSRSDLIDLIEKRAKSGVYLTVLGFGMGNLNDATLEQLADHGNGNYAYIDTMNEATKVLVTDIASTLVTIAKDVKIQVEFNPSQVASYRLIGYENRALAHQDFNDDTKDAGEIGAGHTVTALYEIVPAAEGSASAGKVDDLEYQTPRATNDRANSGEMFTLKLRYKDPDGDSSKLIERTFVDTGASMADAAPGMSLAAAVAELGMLLRDSEHKGTSTYASAKQLAQRAAKSDPHGYRAELIRLIDAASKID